MYATASPGQVVPWAGLKPNVAFDFEIGHWELCSDSSCSSPPDPTENGSSCGTARGVGGCVAKDSDQDGQAYLADWADGTAGHPASIILGAADDSGVGPLSTSTTSLTTYDEGYPTLAFRTTESTSSTFYPFFSQAGTGAACRFNFGNDIPSVTTNDFSKAAQYGTTISNPCLPGSKPVAKCKDTTVPTDPNLCSAATASIDNGSNDPDGDPVTLSQSPPGPYPKGTNPVTLTVTEPETTTNSCTANVIVVDKQLPSISCPSPVVECTSPAGAPVTLNPVVADNCPGLGAPVCIPPSGSTFPLGTDPFSCNVTDASGNSNSCSSVVKVQDTMPPVISSVSANPSTLWPPNHKFVPVKVSVVVNDACDPNPVCTLTGITSSEPPTGGGSGNTSPDFAITGALTASLRAERDGTGPGRIYTLAVQCTDHSGNSSQASTTVTVAHNQ
jgi:hypothetical protein